MLSIGLMSGTSMDGIDAALIETNVSAHHIKDLGHVSITYEQPFKILLKAAEYAIRKCVGNMDEAAAYFPQAINEYLANELNIRDTDLESKIQELSYYLHGGTQALTLADVIKHSTHLHYLAVQQLLVNTHHHPKEIEVIGYHGQTMFHRPSQKITIAIGDGQYLADQLNIKVVNDFRSEDVIAGGQGAPLAPLYHQALAIRDKMLPVAVVNCGGIANITLITNDDELDLIAFDTGPGNGLIDRLIRQRTQAKEHMDKDGQYGRAGKVDARVMQALYEKSIIVDGQSYFALLPPKALDIGDMELIPELGPLRLEDACATLEAFTADSIVSSLGLLNTTVPKRWVLAGGGWKNPVIRLELENRLREKLGDTLLLQTAEEAGWNGQALEAQIFAYLAICSLQNKPLTFPNTTRVPAPQTGGQVWLPKS